MPNYVIITPARDEGAHIRRTIDSVAAQTIRPLRWVIVDDGSTDDTGSIIDEAARQHPWIIALHRPDRGSRQAGGGVIEAFYTGYGALDSADWDYVAKLDGDLSFDKAYFETLLARFALQPKLGIASGVYLEAPDKKQWIQIAMPPYHAAGASKMVRHQCFQEIGGFLRERGWDTVDEIRAICRGWQTRHFDDLKMRHWKPEGSGVGHLTTSAMHGEIYYRLGGGVGFFLLKALRRMLRPPPIAGGTALVWGYLRSRIRRRPRLVTTDEAEVYNSLLLARFRAKVKDLFRARWAF